MNKSLHPTWLSICATTGSPEVLRHALRYQQSALENAPSEAMKAKPWSELREACASIEATKELFNLLLLSERCYFEKAVIRNKGRRKASDKQIALELAQWRASKLSKADFAELHRKNITGSLRVLFDLQGIASPATGSAAVKQRLARSLRRENSDSDFAQLVSGYVELLQLLRNDK